MNKRVMSARADHSPRINHASTLLKTEPGQRMGYVGRGRKATRMTAAQRNSIGRVSEWNRSPYAPRGGWR
jgi:hypothetical protein